MLPSSVRCRLRGIANCTNRRGDGRAECTSKSQLLAFAIERARVDTQDACRVVQCGCLSQDEPDVLGLELVEAHRLRRPRSARLPRARRPCPPAATRLGRSPSPSDGPEAKITARSIAFLSSRRFPGQAYSSSGCACLGRESLDLLAELPGEERQHVLRELQAGRIVRAAVAA